MQLSACAIIVLLGRRYKLQHLTNNFVLIFAVVKAISMHSFATEKLP